jgi:outer membrane lipoprotein-sorting protein
MLTLLAVVPALAPAQGGDEAKKLFEAMEERLAKAKSVSLGFSIEMDFEGKQSKFKGSFAISEGDRMRLEMEGKVEGADAKILLVSDGKRLRQMLIKGEPATEVPTPKNLSGALARTLSRAGLGSGLAPLELENKQERELKPGDLYPVSDLKSGGKEKVGNREAQVLTYKSDHGSGKVEITVWIDPLARLPLKRVLTGSMGKRKYRFVELYTGIKIDEKLDPKQFELPK